MYTRIKFLVLLFFISFYSFSQEGIPVYSDYLSDNYYLVHPSMAGAANCAKLRFTGRKQWFNQQDAPELQTLSLNGRVGERTGAGLFFLTIKMGIILKKGLNLPMPITLCFQETKLT